MPIHQDKEKERVITLKKILVLLALMIATFSCVKDTDPKLPTEQPPIFGRSPYLLSAVDVADLLQTPNPPLLIETSKPESFAKGHLPGAINIWRPDYADNDNYSFGGMKASREKIARLLGNMGAKKEELIIVYCTKGSVDAARFQWILRNYGHDQVALMDGGKAAWFHAGFPLVEEASKIRVPSNYDFPSPEQENYCTTLKEVLAAITDTNTIIVDTREDYEYLGTPHLSNGQIARYKAGASTRGAIPGARHLNWSESVDLHSDHTFKSLADLNHNFRRQGIVPHKNIIVYCQSGVRSAHTTFVLKHLLGYPNVKNYDGSWIEWSYVHAADTMGTIEQHTSQEEAEIIYRKLADQLKE